jgi:hypothetical protein
MQGRIARLFPSGFHSRRQGSGSDIHLLHDIASALDGVQFGAVLFPSHAIDFNFNDYSSSVQVYCMCHIRNTRIVNVTTASLPWPTYDLVLFMNSISFIFVALYSE